MAGSPGNSFFSDSEENFKRRKPGNVCVWWEALVTAPNPPPQSAFPSLTLLSFPLQPLWSGRTGHLLTPLLNPSPEPSTHLCYRGPLSWFLPSPHYLSSLILISLCPPVLASVDSTNTTGWPALRSRNRVFLAPQNFPTMPFLGPHSPESATFLICNSTDWQFTWSRLKCHINRMFMKQCFSKFFFVTSFAPPYISETHLCYCI